MQKTREWISNKYMKIIKTIVINFTKNYKEILIKKINFRLVFGVLKFVGVILPKKKLNAELKNFKEWMIHFMFS